MYRIDRRDIEIRAAIVVKLGPKDLRRAVENGTMLVSEAKIAGFVAVVLDEVFGGDAVLVRPSRVMKPRGNTELEFGADRPGRWGVDEPWPFDGDPPHDD